MPRLTMMIGLPGSGKSFAAENIIEGIVVSSDALREELFGDVNDQSHNPELFNELHKRIMSNLKKGNDVIYDATNLSRKRRKSFLKTLPAGTEKVAVVVATELDVVLEQNRMRERNVPEDVILKMFKNMTLPTPDEGWDDITVISSPKNTKSVGDYFLESRGIDHDSPWHPRDIYTHMLATYDYVLNHADKAGLTKSEKLVASTAALLHDIGKPAVKSRLKRDGSEDTCSHYYNHEEVGAYLIYCGMGTKFNKLLLDVAKIVQWHMYHYQGEGFVEKFHDVYKDESLTKAFKLVCEADEKSP